MQRITLRPSLAGDADAICALFLAARREMTYLPSLHTDAETRSWIAHVVLAQCTVTVAEIGGAIAGFAAVRDGWLDHLYVAPDQQGRTIGSHLVEAAKAANPAGFKLHVFQQNIGARRFYERHGLHLVALGDGSDNEERVPDALYAWRGNEPPVTSRRR